MRRFQHTMLLAGALWALSGGDAHAAPTPGVSIIGITAGTRATVGDLDQAKAVGAKIVRLELPWQYLEPERAGERDPAALAVLDATMQAARQRGLKVVLLTDQTPCWTSTAPPSIRDTCAQGFDRYPPADYAAYGELSAFLASRFQGVLAALEVWNEPDQSNELYWAGPDKVARYAALLKATYPAVKRAAPSVPVLAGAIVGKNGAFLEALYKNGIKGFYDGISVHFYGLPLLGLRVTRVMQRRYGDRAPLWLLETGWNACRPAVKDSDGQPCVTQGAQARNLRDLVAQTRRTSYLKVVAVYRLRDYDRSNRFGLLSLSGARKPSFRVFQTAFRSSSKGSRVAMRVRRQGGALRVTGSGPQGDIYKLEVRSGRTLRYRATFVLDVNNRFQMTLPAQLGTRRLRLRLVSMWRPRAAATRRT